MSARHPTPWTIQLGDNGKRGKARAEWASILDANGVFVAEGLDESTAKEIVFAVNTPGNGAALRAALEPFPSLCDWLVANAGKDALGGGIQEMIHILRERADKARTALSAPPRNCDRFRTEEEAYAEFGKAGNAFGADTSERLYRYARWLFATEGGAR